MKQYSRIVIKCEFVASMTTISLLVLGDFGRSTVDSHQTQTCGHLSLMRIDASHWLKWWSLLIRCSPTTKNAVLNAGADSSIVAAMRLVADRTACERGKRVVASLERALFNVG